jgi:hypothetical protein
MKYERIGTFQTPSKRKFLNHGVHVAQGSEFQRVLRLAGGPGIPAGDLPAAHFYRRRSYAKN